MARGRHVRRTGLRAWLVPDEPPPPSWRTVHAQSLVLLSDDLRVLQEEVRRLRAGTERSTAAQVVAELRAERLEAELAETRAQLAALRADVDALREELVWAFADRRAAAEPAPVTRLPGRRSGTR
jgi:ABC-type phosphate transport system auxiliary subunit